jgi:hypothetical protein
VLTDVAKGTKNKIENLRRSKILKENHILTVANFCGQGEADVEDIVGIELYVEIVNRAFVLPPERAITAESVKANAGGAERLLEGVEALFRVMPPAIPDFDHYRPASWLASNETILVPDHPGSKAALDRFETLFVALNALLPEPPSPGRSVHRAASGTS